MIRLALIFTVFMLAGCVQQNMSTDHSAQIEAEIEGARADCEALFVSKKLKSNMARAKCVNEKFTSIANRWNLPHHDLLLLSNAKRLEVAERLDKKKITLAQAELEMAEFGANIGATIQGRDSANESLQMQRRSLAIANTAATGQMLQGLAAQQQANQPAPRVGFTCQRMGAFTNCY